jgi:SAM-dependent methyltransferase
MSRSNSSGRVSPWEKLRYWAGLLRLRMGADGGEASALRDLDELRMAVAQFEELTGKRAADCAVVEVGFGARPRRALMLSGFFARVYAIDLDAPLFTTLDVLRAARKNGVERAVKSLVRHLLFERREWREFHRTMREALPGYDPDRVRFVIGSAGDERTWSAIGQVDLALSFDVFEHIPPADLQRALAAIRCHLAPGGVVITRPCVFTGIFGGHNLEWYPDEVERQSPETAWGHLTDPNFRVNTYLNRLARRDYCRLFDEAGFDILRDHARRGRFGERHLTPENRARLAGYDDYELFSNEVEFHLKPRTRAAAAERT